MEKKIRVLVITYHPWREDISVGNTLTNVFSGMEDRLEFAHVYFRDDMPSNKFVTHFFHISEKQLFKSIFNRKPVGRIERPNLDEDEKQNFSKVYNDARRLRWDIFLLAQDMIGVLGKWKSSELDKFVEDYSPDIIFGPLGRMPVTNNVMTYLSQKFKIPLVLYPWDDHYSLKKKSFSPIFWIKIFLERQAIRKCALQSELLYTITDMMREEYQTYFNKPCHLLFKGYDFKHRPEVKALNSPLKLIYMGNIGDGRWKVLACIANAINEINQDQDRMKLFIYTLSPISNEMNMKLNVGNSRLMPPVPSEELISTQQSADILLHVEPTSDKERLMLRLSFSTKIVDYLYNAKCILAIGGETATMKYLRDYDAGIVVNDMSKIKSCLHNLILKPEIIKEYAEKAWECGKSNHQIKEIQLRLYNDLLEVSRKYADKQTKCVH